MRLLFGLLVMVHGLIHLMGFAKGWRLAELPQLTQAISKPLALLWLLATVLLLATAAAWCLWPRWWWAVGAVALVVSQIVIITAWSDARYGTIANVLLLIAVGFGFLSQGPSSFRAEYALAAERVLTPAAETSVITEADLAHLPEVVRKYLRTVGVVGQPRIHNFRARFRGQIRSGPNARWMTFTAEQVNDLDEPSRIFLMKASMFGVPMEALHKYLGPSATMRVKVASLLQVADAKGPDMDRAETVTLLNDMCFLAPASLITRSIRWEEVDARTVRAFYTNAGQTISAELSFNAAGELIDFWSDDRLRSTPDGKTFTRTRWSTPLSDYRAIGPRRVSFRGEARWHPAEGEFAYGRFDLQEIEYNVDRLTR